MRYGLGKSQTSSLNTEEKYEGGEKKKKKKEFESLSRGNADDLG